MSQVLLVATPLPQALSGRRIEAAHYRTWQFLQPLVDDGHAVAVCACVAEPGSRGDDWRTPAIQGVAEYRRVNVGARGWESSLQQAHDTFGPDCVVAVNYLPCLAATKLRTNRPIWMDIYGDQITIQQSFCHRMGSDRGMPTTVRFMRHLLRTGDVFSGCGEVQKHMLVGELAMCGRLNRRSFGYEFVRVILPGAPGQSRAAKVDRQAFRTELGLDENAFAVLWCGGYNTWTDVDTLFAGVDAAMALDPRVHFVSVGASTYDASGNMYQRLLAMIGASAHRDRWHMRDWQPWTQIPLYYASCEVGVNIDAMHYETLYGTRTRLVEMIANGLPVITTKGTELSALLREAGAGVTFPVGSGEGLARALCRLAADDACLGRMAAKARELAAGRLSFGTTTAPLRDWARLPESAPDRDPGRRAAAIAATHGLRALVRDAVWRLAGKQG